MDFPSFIKFLILLISPIPNYEKVFTHTVLDKSGIVDTEEKVFTQFLSDYIFALMFLRLVFVFNCYFNFNPYKNQYVKDIC